MGGPDDSGGVPASGRASGRSWAVRMAVFALGFSGVLTQVVLMREMLGAFAGNELVLGVVLGHWLFTMGLGTALGGRFIPPGTSSHLGVGLLTVTALAPPAQVLLLRGLRPLVFQPGEAVGLMATAGVSLTLLLPYGLAAGAFLAWACRAWADRGVADGAGRVYLTDSLGSVLGGGLVGLGLAGWLDHVALLGLPALVNLVAAAWLGWGSEGAHRARGPGWAVVPLLFAAGLLIWLIAGEPDAASTARQFPGQRLLYRGHSPYGRLVVTESAGQTNLIENGLVLATTPNLEVAEESVHLAMAQRPLAKRVLLIGGSLTGAPAEILRYRGVTTLDLVELDPQVVDLARQWVPEPMGDPRLRLWAADARQFVRQVRSSYDVVLIALPDPATAQLNRFYTLEFFEAVKKRLTPEGVLGFGLGRYENYASPELADLLSCARQTVAQVFPNVLLLPAGRVYFLAAAGSLTHEVASGWEQAGVPTHWVTRSWVKARFTPDRLADVARAASRPVSLNRDFVPRLYHGHVRHWASQFQGNLRWLLIGLGLAAGIYLARLPDPAKVVWASGFGGSALEVLLLLAMQTLVGSVYRQLAWVVTMFMAGLAVGAWGATRRLAGGNPTGGGTVVPQRGDARSWLGWSAVGIAALAASLPVICDGLVRWPAGGANPRVVEGVLLLFTFSLAAAVGFQFPLATALSETHSHPAGRVYTADFLGACLGAWITSGWMVPWIGLAGTAAVSAGLNLLAAGLCLVRRSGRT